MAGLDIYFGCLLIFVASVMGTLAARTAIQVFRLRNKRLSWRAGTLGGFPLFSSIFMAISFVLAAAMWTGSSMWGFVGSIFYLFISASWFITSYFSSKRYVTDNGLVKNVNDPSQTIAWHQIRDFVEQEDDRQMIFTFIYNEQQEEYSFRRLELKIPPRYAQDFKKLISHKLGRRISCYDDISFTVRDFK